MDKKPRRAGRLSARVKRDYTDKEIIDALREKRGLVHLAAEYIGCTTSTILKRIREQPYLRAVLEEARGKLIDTAEEKLAEAVEKAEPWAIQMTLKTIGKDRGYIERKEHRHGGDPNSPPISIENRVTIDIDVLPLETRRRILEDHRKREAEAKVIEMKNTNGEQ